MMGCSDEVYNLNPQAEKFIPRYLKIDADEEHP